LHCLSDVTFSGMEMGKVAPSQLHICFRETRSSLHPCAKQRWNEHLYQIYHAGEAG
jgi:hypothetical protein